MASNDMAKLVMLSLAVIICVILLLDTWVIATHGEEASISSTINRLAREHPALPFAAGVLVAHVFKM